MAVVQSFIPKRVENAVNPYPLWIRSNYRTYKVND